MKASQRRTNCVIIARGAGNGENITEIEVLPHWKKRLSYFLRLFVRQFFETLSQLFQISKNEYSTYHDVCSGSNAEDKDGVQVGEQVSLRRENGEEETGKGEAGQIANHN